MMESLLHSAPVLYFASSDEGILKEVNDQLCSAVQYNKEELLGKNMELFCTIATRIFLQTHLLPMLQMRGSAEEIFFSLQSKNGESVPVLVNAQRTKVEDSFITAYAGIVVRNRQKFEEQLILARNAAEKAARENTELIAAKNDLQKRTEELDQQIYTVRKQNEELKQFNKIVTHDFQEPLRKLLLFSGLLTTDKTESQTAQKIRRVTNDMRSILQGLQRYIWLDEASPEIRAVDLDNLVQKVHLQISEYDPSVRLTVETQGLQQVQADAEQLGILLYELMANAVRFRKEPAAARLRIETHTMQRNLFRSTDGKYKYVEFLRLRVADDGLGFDSTYREQVFELFKRFHPQSGPGVGLSLCKKIVEKHGGTISISSEIGKGTTVVIDLPMHNLAQEVLRADKMETI